MTSIHTGLSSSSHKPSFQAFRRRAYTLNGWDKMRVWDGIATTDAEAGIDGPGTEPTDWTPAGTEVAESPGVTSGSHKVRYRYKDSTTGYVSNPSNEYTVSATGGRKFQFPVVTSGAAANILASGDPKVDTIVVEMTDVNNTTFYVAAEGDNAAGTIEVTRTDTQLRELGIIVYPETENNKPPYARYALEFRDRMFMFGQVRHSDGSVAATNGDKTLTGTDTNWTAAVEGRFIQFNGETKVYEIDSFTSSTEVELRENYAGSTGSAKGYTLFSRLNDVFFSHAAFPESWPSNNYFQALSGEEARAIVGFGNSLVIFGLRTIERFSYNDSIATGTKRPVPGNRGALNQEVVVVVDNKIYSMDETGMFVYSGGEPQHISLRADSKIRELADFNFSAKFHAVFYPKLRAIRWFVVRSGDTECKLYFEHYVDSGIWGTGELDFAITFSAQVPRGQGLGVMVGDESGLQWWDDEGVTVGGTAAVSNALVSSGATTTSIPLQSTTLPTSGNGLAGVPAYFPATGELRRVSSNTATAIVLDAALDTAPSLDEDCYLGRVVGKLRTKEFSVTGDLKDKQRGTHLFMRFEPLSSQRYLRVRVYEDGASTAKTDWGGARHAAARTLGEGVTAPADGTTDWLVDLSKADGVARIPIGMSAKRTVSFEFEVTQPDAALALYEYEFGALHERARI